MAKTLKSFLVQHNDPNAEAIAKRLRVFAKEAKVAFAAQVVTVNQAENRTGHLISLNASTMTSGRKLKDFARKIDWKYHY
jgi:guanylate kinase